MGSRPPMGEELKHLDVRKEKHLIPSQPCAGTPGGPAAPGWGWGCALEPSDRLSLFSC